MRAKGRRELGQYLIEGVRAVEAAVLGGAELVDVVVSASGDRVDRIRAMASCPVLSASTRDVEAIGDAKTSQGIVAAARIPAPATVPAGPVLVLDGVQDPGNVGTLIRTAAWFGVQAVICADGTADPWQPKVVRSSQGGLWDLAVVRSPDPVGLLAGRSMFIADMRGVPLSEWRPEPDAVLVLGSEAHGVSQAFREASAGSVHIAGRGTATESLNVSVAGGILMAAWLG